MKEFTTPGFRYDNGQLFILDQTLLPHRQEWLACCDVDSLVAIIKRLAIRGAPAIGITAAIMLALEAERGRSPDSLRREAKKLISSRPTAINLRNNISTILEAIDEDYPEHVIRVAEKLLEEERNSCLNIAQNGVPLLRKGMKILTHCHTGAIATAGRGTALGIIATAHEEYGDIFVWVDETRPLLQGGRLTAWECSELAIPHRIICDNMAGMLMAKKEIDLVLLGSDRIAANGDFANKIGTYSLAVLAKHHNIPFYVAAPESTVDPTCPTGAAIPIEERPPEEVKGVMTASANCMWAPDESPAFNPAFDITPRELVTGWILDTGLFTGQDLKRSNWWKGC